MKINLKGRHIDNNFYLVSGREAWALARETPKGKVPQPGYELRVDVNGQPAWLTRTTVLGKRFWAVYSCDLVVEPKPFNMYEHLSYNTVQRIRLLSEPDQSIVFAHEILRCLRNELFLADFEDASTFIHEAMGYLKGEMSAVARERWAF